VTRIRQFRIARDREINVARRPPQNLFNSIDPRRTWTAGVTTAGPSIQNDSGLPQGPADPSTGRLLMRQTACARRVPSWYDRRRHPWEGAPCSA
jgi:hypothetical protein